MEPNKKVIKSYVWYDDKCFFVSTIERDSSAVLGLDRYYETIAWEFNWDDQRRGNIVAIDGSGCGDLRAHFEMCKRLHETGDPEKIEES